MLVCNGAVYGSDTALEPEGVHTLSKQRGHSVDAGRFRRLFLFSSSDSAPVSLRPKISLNSLWKWIYNRSLPPSVPTSLSEQEEPD